MGVLTIEKAGFQESLQTLGPSRKLMRIEVERGLPHLDKGVGPRVRKRIEQRGDLGFGQLLSSHTHVFLVS